jgi:hypothetical protein
MVEAKTLESDFLGSIPGPVATSNVILSKLLKFCTLAFENEDRNYLPIMAHLTKAWTPVVNLVFER